MSDYHSEIQLLTPRTTEGLVHNNYKSCKDSLTHKNETMYSGGCKLFELDVQGKMCLFCLLGNRNTVENSCLHILLAHPCLYYYLFYSIKSTVYCPAHSLLLYILSYMLFFFTLIFSFIFFSYQYLCIFCVLHIIALSMERD